MMPGSGKGPIGPLRAAAVILLSLLVVPVTVLTEAYVTARSTALTPAFLSRRLAEAADAVSRPPAYQEMVGSLVGEVTRGMKLPIPADFSDAVKEAAASFFTPSWAAQEASRLAGEILSWITGRTARPDLSVSLAWFREDFPRRLAAAAMARMGRETRGVAEIRRMLEDLPSGVEPAAVLEREIAQRLTGIPDSVDLTQAMGAKNWDLLVRIRNLHLLYSLFLIFAVPVVLAAALVLAGRPVAGLAGMGAAVLSGSGLFLLAAQYGKSAYPAAVAGAVMRFPSSLSWASGILSAGLTEVLAYARTSWTVGLILGAACMAAAFLVSRVRGGGEGA